LKKHLYIPVIASLLLVYFLNAGCRASYGFNNVSIPDTMHTIKINFIENLAPYRNAQLSPALTERLRRKITGQTRLSEVKGDNADYDMKATITDYSVSTTGISDKKVNMNRLTVTVHVALRDQKASTTQEYDVTWQTEFNANLSLQAAESAVFETMVRSLADDIFNRMFSIW
jgi:hypothetical protein